MTKKETFYVIDEEVDSLEVVVADSAETVVRELYQVDDPNMAPFYLTIFNAKDAQRFEISPDVTIETSYRKVK